MTKTLKVKLTTGRNGKHVITIEHIYGDYAEFTENQLVDLAATLICIAADVKGDQFGNNKTREYTI